MDMRVPFFAEFAEEAGYVSAEAGAGLDAAGLRCHLEAHYRTLHRRLAHDLGCTDRASDSLHDAWLKLGDMAPTLRVRNADAYVYRVARNLALDQLRTERRIVSWEDLEDEAALPDPQPGPAQTAEARSVLARLERALVDLPYRHQCVLFDVRVAERTRAEVAETYGLSTRNVDTLVRQALDHCAARLRGTCADGESLRAA
ncbi:ECF family sigma factor [Bordetella ansorpii]|uniref:ECF family sigma factor n=1 Tax=Bordetella ansorpii TaxID=288768 RepID=A0A157QJE3_9BORD|nr:sigma-70 family RNA polymerase sigma factor [Bordetella ansorpii]SAI46075.1 ECF family sigma factor [Bordetella ansorpii]